MIFLAGGGAELLGEVIGNLIIIALISFLTYGVLRNITNNFWRGENASPKSNYKPSPTESNILKQSEMAAQWHEKNVEEADLNKPDESIENIYEFVRTLCEKNDIPITDYPLLKKEEDYLRYRDWSAREEEEMQELAIHQYEGACEGSRINNPDSDSIIAAYTDEDIKKLHELYLKGADEFEKRWTSSLRYSGAGKKAILSHAHTEIYGNCSPFPPSPPPELFFKNKTLFDRIKQNEYANNIWGYLMRKLVSQSMAARGYKMGTMTLDTIEEAKKEKIEREKAEAEAIEKHPILYAGYVAATVFEASENVRKDTGLNEMGQNIEKFEKIKETHPRVYENLLPHEVSDDYYDKMKEKHPFTYWLQGYHITRATVEEAEEFKKNSPWKYNLWLRAEEQRKEEAKKKVDPWM
jgi:hypothetical protein